MPITIPSASEPTITCYTKTRWASSWTENPLILARQITDQAAPGHSSAVVQYRYGKAILPAIGSRPADSTPATISRADIIGNYLKITVSGLGDWYGVITDKGDIRNGEIGTTPSGMEVYTAFGLTWFLDNYKPVTQSRVRTSSGTQIIDRAIPFNGGTDGTVRKNRVTWKNYDSLEKCFSDRSITTSLKAWKAADAVAYLLKEFSPRTSLGAELIPFELHPQAKTFLDYELPYLDYDRMTVWQILNKIIDRRRGLGWHGEISGNAVRLVVWSQNASVISLPSGSIIPANPNTRTYDFDDAVNIGNAIVSTSLMTRYDQVEAIGERCGSIFTVRPQTSMEPDWSTDQQTAYNDAATAKTGYSSLSDPEKEAANNDRRAADDLDRVFSWWRIKLTWNGRADTDPSSATHQFAFPKINEEGFADGSISAKFQRAGLRIEPYIPLRKGLDYTADITPETQDGDEFDSDFLAPILLFQVDVLRASTTDDGWVHCERLNQSIDSGSTKRAFKYSVDLAVKEDSPGLVLRTVGAPQHFICADRFVSDGAFEDIPSAEQIDSDDWLATVYIQQDTRTRAMYPANADLPPLDLVRRLTLFVPDAHFDFLVPGTVVAVDAGELKKSTGGYVRDDRKKLRDISKLAYTWYGQQRRILNLQFRAIASGFSVGHLITEIGSGGNTEEINTCITSVSYDLQTGVTQLHTQFGELDFTDG